MNLVTALILGILNAAIIGVALLLVGALVQWGLTFIGVAIPAIVVKLYIGLVVLICLTYVVAALLGSPITGPVSRPFWH